MHKNHIISLMNIIYGLEDESWHTIWTRFRKLFELDGDILNAEYITPHFWTSEGRAIQASDIIQTDLSKWTYRNQVIATPYLEPTILFFAVKLTEVLFHLRPKSLWRLLTVQDKRYQKIMRASMWIGMKVVLAEIYEFFFQTRFSPQGSLEYIPGSPVHARTMRNEVELHVA